jgi:hypothetical protein
MVQAGNLGKHPSRAIKQAWKSVEKLTSAAFLWQQRVAVLYSRYSLAAT